MENLDRGLVAVQTSNGVFLSWRVFGTDPKSISFNIYRNGTKINSAPITGATNMVDGSGSSSSTYTVRPIVGGVEQSVGGSATVWGSQVRTITLSNRPSSNHAPNDINVGDLDGDGKYDLVVKWYPANSKDNSQSGVTDNTYLAAYKMDGTFMWIIDLGRNIRSGAHYTQHLVGDYNYDGKAEVACKTAPGTRDGTGTYLSIGPAASDNDGADYRNSSGYILTGPEYLTIFNGQTGKEMATVNYPVPRGNVGSWGDTYGNRVDRFNATNAYVDGVHPTMIFARGYYTRLTAAAIDWNGQSLSTRWIFDSNNSGNSAAYGQGNHSIMSADIDNDGFDEILTGSCAIDHDGKFKWATGYGHGDANHVGDFDPNSPGLEVWQVSENTGSEPDHYMIRASDGHVLWRNGNGHDNGRGMVADIDSRYPGQEAWSNSVAGTYSANGTQFTSSKPGSTNFRIYWDGDLLDELPNGSSNNTNNRIDKWNGNGTSSILTLTGLTCNGTKATANIVADLFGDWREEIILHDGANRLYIHTTTILTQHKLYTLMHDPVYRNAISWQQSSYNQPPHLGFYLGSGVENAPTPNIVLVGAENPNQLPAVSITAPTNNANFTAPASITISANASDADGTISSVAFFNGTTLLGTDAASPYSFNWTNVPSGSYTIRVRATDNDGASAESTVTITVNPAPSGTVLQAETACTVDGIMNENINAGFNGTGYVNTDNASGTSVTWAVNSTNAQNVTLSLRYANGSANSRNMSLAVNGTTQVATVNFASTGAWTSWTTASVQVALTSGNNRITLQSLTNEGGPNIDELAFSTTSVTAGNCNPEPPNTAPVVSITSPSHNTSFTAPAAITISASASDADGTISHVQFYNGATLLGSDATSPYNFTWNNVPAGTYTLTAKATDDDNAVTTSTAVTFIVNPEVNNPPVVSISSPADNASFTAPASVTITATASDPDGMVSNVQFYNGSTLLASDASSPYSFTWTNVAAGTYTITARATDDDDSISVSAPVTIIVNPTPPQGVTIQAETACSVDGIQNENTNAGFHGTGYVNTDNAAGTAVEWAVNSVSTQNVSLSFRYANGSANNRNASLIINGTTQVASINFPTMGAWTTWAITTVQVTLTDGNNRIQLQSLSAEGAANIDELIFESTSISAGDCQNTPPNVPPVVNITAPVSNSGFTAPASITISANASDADGSISNVQFYNGSTLLGSDASAPYSFTWSDVAAGTYTITARATDNSGAETTSSPVTVVVNPPVNQAPVVSITAPANNASFTAPAIVSITVNASDPDGSISNVQFYNGSSLLGSDASLPYSFVWSNVAAGTYTITARATDNSRAVTTSTAIQITVQSSQPAGDIVGPDCGSPNTLITYEVNSSKRTGATAYSWWFQGYTQNITQVSSNPYQVNIQSGQHFTGGEVCVGVSYNIPPYYATYCKSVGLCAQSLMPLGTEESSLAISPNPSTESFSVSSEEEISSIKVVNDLGAVVFESNEISDGSETFGAELPDGLYVIYIEYANGNTEIRKVQKNR